MPLSEKKLKKKYQFLIKRAFNAFYPTSIVTIVVPYQCAISISPLLYSQKVIMCILASSASAVITASSGLRAL